MYAVMMYPRTVNIRNPACDSANANGTRGVTESNPKRIPPISGPNTSINTTLSNLLSKLIVYKELH